MMRINLLPYREIRRQERRQHFYVLAMLVALAAIVAAAGVYMILETRLSIQQDRNQFLETTNRDLDKEIAEIKELDAKIDDLLQRKRVIEKLQGDRGDAVSLLTTLTRQVPEGIYLRSIKQVGKKITLAGYAQNNARIKMMIDDLEKSGFLEKTALVESKAVLLDKRRLYDFSLTTFIQTRKAVAKKDNVAGGGNE